MFVQDVDSLERVHCRAAKMIGHFVPRSLSHFSPSYIVHPIKEVTEKKNASPIIPTVSLIFYSLLTVLLVFCLSDISVDYFHVYNVTDCQSYLPYITRYVCYDDTV